MDTSESKIVVIGGGNGTSTLLRGLRAYTSNLTAIVAMADDGGSTGALRRELGVLPAGDARQCLIALANEPKVQELFGYRLGKGFLDGHNVGNLFIAAAEQMTGSFEEALQIAHDALGSVGQVLPVTNGNVRLALQDGSHKIEGEDAINRATLTGKSPKVWLVPSAKLNASAAQAIHDADLVVIAPGLLYCSTAAALLVEGMSEALEQTPAKVLYATNLVNIPRHNPGFTVQDYVHEIKRFLGDSVLDFVLYSTNLPNPKYLRNGETGVMFDQSQPKDVLFKYIGAQLVSDKPAPIDPRDKIAHTRASVRHDSEATAQAIMDVLRGSSEK